MSDNKTIKLTMKVPSLNNEKPLSMYKAELEKAIKANPHVLLEIDHDDYSVWMWKEALRAFGWSEILFCHLASVNLACYVISLFMREIKTAEFRGLMSTRILYGEPKCSTMARMMSIALSDYLINCTEDGKELYKHPKVLVHLIKCMSKTDSCSYIVNSRLGITVNVPANTYRECFWTFGDIAIPISSDVHEYRNQPKELLDKRICINSKDPIWCELYEINPEQFTVCFRNARLPFPNYTKSPGRRIPIE